MPCRKGIRMANNKEINRIATVVARAFATKVEALKGKSRGSSHKYLVVAARQMLYYYLRTHTTFTLPELSKALQCSHATIVVGAKMGGRRLESNDSFRSDLERIERALGFSKVNTEAEGGDGFTRCDQGADGHVCIEEVRQVKIDRISVVRDGKPSNAYFYRPRISGVPESFFTIPDGAWVPYDESKAPLPTSMRAYVQQLRAEGHEVSVSSCPGGILCFNLNFRGERLALWFNAWTSQSVVIGGDGRVR